VKHVDVVRIHVVQVFIMLLHGPLKGLEQFQLSLTGRDSNILGAVDGRTE